MHPWCHIHSLQAWGWALLHEWQCGPGMARLGCSTGKARWEPNKVIRAGPVAITMISHSPVMSRQGQSDKQVLRSSWDLKPLQSKARHNRHLTQLRQELRPRDRASTLLLGHRVMEGPEEAGQGNDSPCTLVYCCWCTLVPDHHHEGKPRNSVTPWLVKHF